MFSSLSCLVDSDSDTSSESSDGTKETLLSSDVGIDPWRRVAMQDDVIADDLILRWIGQVADQRVRDLADKLATQKSAYIVSNSFAVGPGINYMIAAALLHPVIAVVMFVSAYLTVECPENMLHKTEHGHTPIAWGIFATLCVPHLYCEWVGLRFSCLPFIQMLKQFRISGIYAGFTIWSASNFGMSVVNLISISTNSLFAARWVKCTDAQVDKIWSEALSQSYFSTVDFHLTLQHLIMPLWIATLLESFYLLLTTVPRPGQPALCRDVVLKPTDDSKMMYQNLFGRSVTSGQVFSALGESAGMGTVIAQNLVYQQARADHELRNLDVSTMSHPEQSLCKHGCGRACFGRFSSCCTSCRGPAGPHAEDCMAKGRGDRKLVQLFQQVNSVFPIAFTRLGLRGILKHTLQVNIQIVVLGITLQTDLDMIGHKRLHAFALFSIGVCFLGAVPLFSTAFKILRFTFGIAARLENFSASGYFDHVEDEEQKPSALAWWLRHKSYWVVVVTAILFLGQAYAAVKLIMMEFVCQGGQWNMHAGWNLEQGCVDPLSRQDA